MASAAKQMQRTCLLLLLVAAAISILWGIALERGIPGGLMGFPGIYLGTKCLMQGGDPYDVHQLGRLYDHAGLGDPSDSPARRQSASLYVNLPATFILVAPFACLSLPAAQALWLLLIIASMLAAALMMWHSGQRYAPGVAVLLTFIVLANCETIFSGGNTAGFVVAFTVIACWCFLSGRLQWLGIACLGIALAVKPHDVVLVWLYFLIEPGPRRKPAARAALVALIMVSAGMLWTSLVAPHWSAELRSNLAAISARGGINDPGPASIAVSAADSIIDLQTALSVLRDDPDFYNTVTYGICGLLFLAWVFVVMRGAKRRNHQWFALGSAAAISMLVTYHRSYDAKLLLLCIPACAILWREGGAAAWGALILSFAGLMLTGDIPLAALVHATHGLYTPAASLAERMLIVAAARPIPLILALNALFWLWIDWSRYGRHAAVSQPSAH